MTTLTTNLSELHSGAVNQVDKVFGIGLMGILTGFVIIWKDKPKRKRDIGVKGDCKE